VVCGGERKLNEKKHQKLMLVINKILNVKVVQSMRNRFDLLLLFIFCVCVFTFITRYVSTDINDHLKHIEDINANKTSYPANFGYYLIVNLLSGLLDSVKVNLPNTAIMLLSIVSVMKYAISKRIIESSIKAKKKFSAKSLTLIALSLFFCFAIPDPFSIFVLNKFYLGRFVPFVWHNSTTIFLFPFAIMLFWKQIKVLNPSYKYSINDILILNILALAF
jgi:hypothetical protein